MCMVFPKKRFTNRINLPTICTTPRQQQHHRRRHQQQSTLDFPTSNVNLLLCIRVFDVFVFTTSLRLANFWRPSFEVRAGSQTCSLWPPILGYLKSPTAGHVAPRNVVRSNFVIPVDATIGISSMVGFYHHPKTMAAFCILPVIPWVGKNIRIFPRNQKAKSLEVWITLAWGQW